MLFSAAIDGIEKKVNDRKSGNLGGVSINENESFNRHYNKELRVAEGNIYGTLTQPNNLDEIPIVLLELNESALAFITREQFERALLLL